MTAKIIDFTVWYNVRRLPIYQLQQLTEVYTNNLRAGYKLASEDRDRLRVIRLELNRRKELNNARQQSKRV